MHKAIIEWALDASGFMMGLAVWVFPLVLVTTAVLVIFRRTRPWGGVILCYFSMLVGTATWFFGAAATFASFGWFGLIVGLLLLGLGVVPLGIIGGFVYLDGVGAGPLSYYPTQGIMGCIWSRFWSSNGARSPALASASCAPLKSSTPAGDDRSP